MLIIINIELDPLSLTKKTSKYIFVLRHYELRIEGHISQKNISAKRAENVHWVCKRAVNFIITNYI